MTTIPTIAKIKRPVISNIMPRNKLFRRLKSSMAKPVVWITGPPGSGKTMLVASFVEAFKIPCIWYQVDEGDADVATFFYYMSLAARRVAPQKRKPLPLLTSEYFHGIPAFTKRYFEDLCSRVKPPFILVFDNYQDIAEDSTFHRVISDGALSTTDGITVVVISRGEPPKAFARLRANGMLDIIGWDELKFTFDESKRFIHSNGNKRLSDEILHLIHSRIDGWVAGFVLFMESMKTKNIESIMLSEHLPEEIFYYFAGEIFDKTDSNIRDFLLRTAFLPQISPEMAESLTGSPLAGGILSDLTKKNYFTCRYVHHAEIYQYHPLFREFLLAHAKEFFTPEQIVGIQCNAASIMEEHGQIEEALELFAKAGKWADTKRLILATAGDMIIQGRGKTLESWIRYLPVALIEQNAWLLYWLGACNLCFNPEESRINFEKSFKLFRTEKNPSGLFLSIAGVFDSIHCAMKSFRPFDQWLAIFYELLDEYHYFPSLEIETRVLCSMLSALCLRQPQHPDFEKWEDRALFLAEDCADMNIKTHIYNKLLTHHIFSGNFAKVSLLMHPFREISQSPDISPLVSIMLKYNETVYYWIAARSEESLKAVNKGLQLASETGIHVMSYILLGHGAAVALSLGDMEKAGEFLNRMIPCLDSFRNWEKDFFHFLKTWEAILMGDLNKASIHSELSLKFSHDVGMPHTEAISHLERAHIMHELGDRYAADEHLAYACTRARQVKSKIIEFMCLLTETYFNFQTGDEKTALNLLRKTMSFGREHGYVNTFFWLPSVMKKLCLRALEAGIEVEYVQNLIRKRNLFPDSPPVECENWPWPIKIFTFGRFGLLRDGKPAQFSGKVQQKPLALLKVLISFGGRDITEERLTDILWPQAEGDAAHSAFTTTLARLRHLLGIDQAVKFYDGRASLDSHFCYVDVWAFERILGEVDDAWKAGPDEGSKMKIVGMAEKAVRMYIGPFLSGENEPWTVPIRERLRNKFLRHVGRLGIYWQQTGNLDKAIAYYQKGLEVEELAEEFYRRIMKCYLLMGKKAEAMAVYKRCYQILTTVLGIEPSPETEALKAEVLKEH